MKTYEQLTPKLRRVDLYNVGIDVKPARDDSCFFIVMKPKEQKTIRKIAEAFLLAGCRDYHFYGTREPAWHLEFDLLDSLLFPDSTSETVACTSGYETTEKFADTLHNILSLNTSVPRNLYLFYDDKEVFQKVLALAPHEST